MLKTVEYTNEELIVLDQTLLPGSIVYETLATAESVYDAIATLKVRGAPLIGVVAAYGVLVGIKGAREDADVLGNVERICSYLVGARPTAVNLKWALDRMLKVARNNDKTSKTSNAGRADQADKADKDTSLYNALAAEAQKIHAEDLEINKRIGEQTFRRIKNIIKDNTITIMTHCNAGALATTGYGTATSVMYLMKELGIHVKVFVCETRPLMQGARLTTLELLEAGIDVVLITDSMAATVMASGAVDFVIVGADRVAANLDVANKIGTLGLSLIAQHYGVPFLVACPSPTFDKNTACGEDIIIEERDGSEITTLGGVRIAPQNTPTFNPAFDITPYENITTVITENGILEKS